MSNVKSKSTDQINNLDLIDEKLNSILSALSSIDLKTQREFKILRMEMEINKKRLLLK